MGFNSVLFTLNDRHHEIDDDPTEFWHNAREALAYIKPNEPREFRGQHWAVSNMHADHTVLIAAGGNYPTVLLTHWQRLSHSTNDGQLELAKALADKLGYRLVKKAQK